MDGAEEEEEEGAEPEEVVERADSAAPVALLGLMSRAVSARLASCLRLAAPVTRGDECDSVSRSSSSTSMAKSSDSPLSSVGGSGSAETTCGNRQKQSKGAAKKQPLFVVVPVALPAITTRGRLFDMGLSISRGNHYLELANNITVIFFVVSTASQVQLCDGEDKRPHPDFIAYKNI